MNDALKMQISAFVDGELPATEAELLIRRLAQDAKLREQADAYMTIGRLMRGERSAAGADGLRQRIAEAVEAESELATVAASWSENRWVRSVAGVAIAASVAMLALIGVGQFESGVEAQDPASVASTLATDSLPVYTEPAVAEVLADRPSDRLMQYYLSHGATSGELGANGILSRLVTLELRGGELVEIVPQNNDTEPAADTADDERDPAARDE